MNDSETSSYPALEGEVGLVDYKDFISAHKKHINHALKKRNQFEKKYFFVPGQNLVLPGTMVSPYKKLSPSLLLSLCTKNS